MEETWLSDPATVHAVTNLARMTVPLHASRDLAEVAGHFEHLGERCVDATLTLLILSEEDSGLRVIEGSLRRPPVLEAVRIRLGVQRLSENPDLADACFVVMRTGTAQWFELREIFPAASEDLERERCLVTPVAFAGETLGAGCFVAGETARTAALTTLLADHAAVAVQRVRAHSSARRLHGVDPLLWIPDAESVRENLAHELARARRYGGPVGFTLLSLECVAELRVRHGGFYTDHLLRRIGSHLRTAIRDSDSLGALAEGFAIIHPGADRAGAETAATRLAESVGTMLSSSYQELELSLLSSIDVASVASPDDGTSADELMAAVRDAAHRAEDEATLAA
jgi:GGDEF domain-containing protein